MSASPSNDVSLESDERVVIETKKQILSPHDILLVIVMGLLGMLFPPALAGAALWIPMRLMMDNPFRLWLTNKRVIVWKNGTKGIPESIQLSDIHAFWKAGERVNLLAGVCDISMNFKEAGGSKTFEGLKDGEDFATHLAMQLGFKSINGTYWTG